MTARFKCIQVVENEQGRNVTLQGSAADGTPENKVFFAPPSQGAAGSGQIQLGLVADDTVFKPGKSYVAVFTEVTS